METKLLFFKLLERYRRALFFCHGYTSRGMMPAGVPSEVEDPTIELTHGDVVHPCVRYIEEGFEGHKWWMVYTPYYGDDSRLENPRLCYSDAAEGEVPVKWIFYCTIVGAQETGYNSDPTMIYDNSQLYVFWRECHTPKAKEQKCRKLTVGCKVHSKQVTFLSEPQMVDALDSIDREVSPTLVARNGSYRAYAMHLDFVPQYIRYIPSFIGRKLYRSGIVFLLDALGILNMNKSYGVAIWDSSTIERRFQYKKTVQFKNITKLYSPWHMDIFKSNSPKEDDVLYAVVQTRQRHARICLARCIGGEEFSFFKKPLLTTKDIGMMRLYKPSAVLVGDKFYLFYTAHDNDDMKWNRLFVTSIDWELLMSRISG